MCFCMCTFGFYYCAMTTKMSLSFLSVAIPDIPVEFQSQNSQLINVTLSSRLTEGELMDNWLTSYAKDLWCFLLKAAAISSKLQFFLCFFPSFQTLLRELDCKQRFISCSAKGMVSSSFFCLKTSKSFFLLTSSFSKAD